MKEVSPIKDLDDVRMIYRRLRKWGRYREAELVVLGCNVALRISDILRLRFNDIRLVPHGEDVVGMVELKEVKTGKMRTLTLNRRAMKAVDNLRNLYPDSVYLFESDGNRAKGKPFSRQWISKILVDVRESLDLDYRLNTHSLRKTFGYHAYKQGADINTLQKLFNHASVKDTMRYIGITEERVQDIYKMIDIGV